MNPKQVLFFGVYHHRSLKKIGEVKYYSYRDSHQWTALGFYGRIKDCETKDEAEKLVEQEWVNIPADERTKLGNFKRFSGD